MSTTFETLPEDTREFDKEIAKNVIAPELARTAFEALATSDPIDAQEDIPKEFKMSLTRIPGGQTVPDEGGPGLRE